MARTDQPHKLTFDNFVAKCTDFSDPINEKHRGLDYSRPETRAAWNGSKSKVPIWCTVHAEFFTQMAANHMSLGHGCPKCGKDLRTAKKTKADPIAEFRAVHGDFYDYSEVQYVNIHTRVRILCPEHGPFQQKPGVHLRGAGCPTCWANRRKAFGTARNENFKEAFAERAARVHNGLYAILKAPDDAHGTAELHCPKHGTFEQKAYSHLAGHGCPACGRITSYAQREVADFIAALGVRVEQDNRTVLGGLHIDIWAPDLGIGVEYHGGFWHTQARVGNKHREKWARAEKAGVRLIQMFDFEWLERREAAENRLRALFETSKPYAARACELRPVEAKEANAFFKQWHTQGACVRPRASYGLYADGALLAVMAFGMGRFSADTWELLRYASVGRVAGGFARLFAAFRREHKPDSIISYCDLRWGDGRVYKANGFMLDGVTNPDYWYVSKAQRVSRYAAQHRPKGQSEKDWAEEHGYQKVLGVGHQRWLWRDKHLETPPPV
jgi:hypothetical protein